MTSFADSSSGAMAERLKADLKNVEFEEQRLKEELQKLAAQKKQILNELAKYTDTKHQEDMLALVYKQRKAERSKK